MQLRFSSQVVTDNLLNLHTIADTAFAAGQTALAVAVSNKYNVLSLSNIGAGAISKVGAGAIIGAALRVAYKVQESTLNSIFAYCKENIVSNEILLSPLRKVVEITTAAALVRGAMIVLSAALPVLAPTLLPAFVPVFASMKFTTYLALSTFVDVRPVRTGLQLERLIPEYSQKNLFNSGYSRVPAQKIEQAVIGPRLDLDIVKVPGTLFQFKFTAVAFNY